MYHDLSARVAKLVKCLTLDFSSGHDLTVLEFEPCITGLPHKGKKGVMYHD